MQEYFIWVIPFLLAIYSIRALIRDSKQMKTPTCASCGSTNINTNMRGHLKEVYPSPS